MKLAPSNPRSNRPGIQYRTPVMDDDLPPIVGDWVKLVFHILL